MCAYKLKGCPAKDVWESRATLDAAAVAAACGKCKLQLVARRCLLIYATNFNCLLMQKCSTPLHNCNTLFLVAYVLATKLEIHLNTYRYLYCCCCCCLSLAIICIILILVTDVAEQRRRSGISCCWDVVVACLLLPE